MLEELHGGVEPEVLPDGVNVEWDPDYEPDFDHAAELAKRAQRRVQARMTAPEKRDF